MKKYLSILFILLAALVAVSFSGCMRVSVGGDSNGTEASAATSAPAVTPEVTESPADDMYVKFSTTALDGTTVTQDFFKDHKVNFVHFWATWCGPCVGELPELPALYEQYKDSVGFIAIVDPEGAETAQQVLDDSKVTFLCVNNFPELETIFGVIEYVPCTILVDDLGKPISEQIVGAVGIGEYTKQLDAALKASE